MIKKADFLLILSLLASSCVLVNANGVVGGYGGVTLSAWTEVPPTIDGVMGPEEWDQADSYDFVTDNPATLVGGTLYVMNDANNLYLFVVINIDDEGLLKIMFDNDNDRIEWEADDDGLLYNWVSGTGFFDLHYSAWGEDGSKDGEGAHSGDASHEYVEFSHPLNSGDAEDFSLAIGDTVGFQILIDLESAGNGWWPSEANTTNDILIAGPPEPVGGELVNSSSSYIILTLLMLLMILIPRKNGSQLNLR
jgi:hypothetical protein